MVNAAFLYLGKFFLKMAADKALMKALPKIYEKLDQQIPIALFNGASPIIVKSEIEHTVMKTIKKPATKEVVELISALYDPIQNADRIQRRVR